MIVVGTIVSMVVLLIIVCVCEDDCSHEYGKWSTPNVSDEDPIKQYRTCLKCRKIKARKVR